MTSANEQCKVTPLGMIEGCYTTLQWVLGYGFPEPHEKAHARLETTHSASASVSLGLPERAVACGDASE
ncbi:MAG: hypothetical protein E6995_17330 [Enterobacteriaceae bacterium]|uniref:hypothetical protein n=1 Tax=Hafnia paralvei TaxID=546367 RepID=UPI0007E32853|nr:hypothetical protein [Hafnia paralvei]MDU1193859.1 hypothetical protein [Enterobacteriaceae bacterium]MDU1245975.1 hypothetical protein [Enterobacteriaceae bacterium]HCU16468.1 hypothetical protein [Hafnia paralvei]